MSFFKKTLFGTVVASVGIMKLPLIPKNDTEMREEQQY
ncbi:hypothetical protein OVS_03860 [Mycoplasma ovis str. Michigan]|uniref:Uncharacterized protein n=1 Tax=Mycoplasma ovis str. Michigan TaxID=1415773 RepID=A0ABN4BRI5_9MOLU|nr:hypothetical protein OVS_03860 [Mycoplasma ovis str. Michigan]